MKAKKVVTGLMALMLAASSVVSLTGCDTNKNVGHSYIDEQNRKIYVYKFNMYTQDDTVYPETHDNAFDQMLLDRFNIYFDYDRIPRTDWETKTNTYFATGDAPDLTT